MTDQEMRQVVLAHPQEIDGKTYPPESVVTVPLDGYPIGARALVRDGLARWPEPEPKKTARPEQKGA